MIRGYNLANPVRTPDWSMARFVPLIKEVFPVGTVSTALPNSMTIYGGMPWPKNVRHTLLGIYWAVGSFTGGSTPTFAFGLDIQKPAVHGAGFSANISVSSIGNNSSTVNDIDTTPATYPVDVPYSSANPFAVGRAVLSDGGAAVTALSNLEFGIIVIPTR